MCLALGNEKYVCNMNEPNSQAKLILPLIEQMLVQNDIWYDAIGHLAVTVGPGSFSGLRIGLAVAQSLVFAHPHITRHCYTTLECIVAGYEGPRQAICAVIPAGKGDVYAQCFRPIGAAQWQVEGEIILCRPADALHLAKDRPLVGHGNTLLHPDAAQGTWPHAKHLAHAAARYEGRDTLPLKPLYIRPPDAKLPSKSAL